ncbi:hypothetical protein FAI41_04595 [Acetobacteraceae bacterium]|nr:hypothetical protein FAI41_04595 [Acetobacteraceae bacterium]
MRKSIEYLIEDGPDKGKIFIITRMSAFEADEWAADVIQALTKAGTKLHPSREQFGIAGLENLSIGIFANLEKEDRKKAYQDLLNCCQIKRDPKNPLVQPTKILEVDIEDPKTLYRLRTKAFELHMDFIKAAACQVFHLAAAMFQTEGSNEERK